MKKLDPNLQWICDDVNAMRVSVKNRVVLGSLTQELAKELKRLEKTVQAVQEQLLQQQRERAKHEREWADLRSVLEDEVHTKTLRHAKQLEEMRALSLEADGLAAVLRDAAAKHQREKQIVVAHISNMEGSIDQACKRYKGTMLQLAGEQQRRKSLNNMLSTSTNNRHDLEQARSTVHDDLDVVVQGRMFGCMDLGAEIDRRRDKLVEVTNETPVLRAALQNIESTIATGQGACEACLPLLRWMRRSCDVVETSFKSQSCRPLEEVSSAPPEPLFAEPSGDGADYISDLLEVADELQQGVSRVALCVPPFAPFILTAHQNEERTAVVENMKLDKEEERLVNDKLKTEVTDMGRKLDETRSLCAALEEATGVTGWVAIHIHTGLTDSERASANKTKRSLGPLRAARVALEKEKKSLMIENRDLHNNLKGCLETRAALKEELWSLRSKLGIVGMRR